MKKILINIISRLQKRFQLRAVGSVQEIELVDNVQPITNVDTLLKTTKIRENTLGPIAVSGTYVFLTVPAGKRWTLKVVQATVTSGTMLVGSFGIRDPVSTNSISLEVLQTGLVNHATTLGGQELILTAGWELEAYVAVTTPGNLDCAALIEEEEEYQ